MSCSSSPIPQHLVPVILIAGNGPLFLNYELSEWGHDIPKVLMRLGEEEEVLRRICYSESFKLCLYRELTRDK